MPIASTAPAPLLRVPSASFSRSRFSLPRAGSAIWGLFAALALLLLGLAPVASAVDDDPLSAMPEVSITAGPDITLGREAVFTLTAAPAPSAALEVKVAVTETDSSGDAVESTRRVTIPVGGTVELRLGTPYNKVGDPDNPGDADEPDRRYTAALVSGAGYAVSGDASRAEVSVFDPPMVVFHDAKGTEGSALVFTAKLTSPSPGGVSVFWETAGLWERDMVREAEAGVDYETASGTLDFALGEVEKTLTVETYDNTRNDVDKLFQVRMTGAKRIMQSRRFPHAVGTILDDDDPGVSVHIHDAEGAEGSVLEFSVTLSKPSPGGVWVTWVTADGAAKAGVDYEAASGRLEFALGEVKKTLSVRTLDDAHNDSGETFHVVLDGTKGVRNPRVGGRFHATGTILDDDNWPSFTPEVSVSAGSDVTEGGDAVFTLTADPPPQAPLAVEVQFKAPVGEFTALDSQHAKVEWVTIPAGGTVQWKVSTEDDETDEPDGLVSATLVPGAGYTVSATARLAAVAITDDDDPDDAGVSATIHDAQATEGSDIVFSVTLSEPSPGGVWISWATLDWPTALADIDYESASGRLEFAVGEVEKTLSVRTLGDNRHEMDEAFHVVFENSDGVMSPSAGGRFHAAGTILDDDPPAIMPEVSVVAVADVTEGGDAVFTLTADPAPPAPLAVDVRINAPAGDFTGLEPGGAAIEWVMIPPSGTAQWKVPTENDETDEPDGLVTATLVPGAGYTVSSTARLAAVAVFDDDDPEAAGVSATIHDAQATEGSDVVFSVTLSEPSPGGVWISWSTLDWPTAEAGVDYESASGRLEFAAGEVEKTLSVRTLDDDHNEVDEAFHVVFDNSEGVTSPSAGGRFHATGIVIDDDDPGVSATIHDAQGTEGSDIVFSVTLSEPSRGDVWISWATFDWSSTAEAGIDYEFASGRLEFAAGEVKKTLSVRTLDDDRHEADEVFHVVFGGTKGVRNAQVSGRFNATGTIIDDDPVVPEVTITGGADVTEGGDALFTLKAAPAPVAALTVEVHLKAPTGEFTALASDGAKVERVTIPTGGTAQLKVATIDDTTDEPDGSVSATLVAGEGYTVSATAGQAAVSVLDNDDPAPVVPEVTITGGADVTEGGDALFTLKAAPAPVAALTVEVHLKAPTGEFTALASDGAKVERVTIPTGGTAQLKVATIDDTTDEPDGSVSATLVAGDGYTVSATAGQAAVPVLDNDDPAPVVPEVTITGGADVTEGGDALFTLKAAPAPVAALTVEVHLKAPTGEFTALASDGAKVERVTIPTGGTAQLKVATIDDTTDEPDGSVSATLVAGDGYTVSATAGQAAVSVLDNDDPAPVVPEVTITGGADVTEGGDALFTLKAAPGPAAALTVEVHLKAPTGEFTALASDGAKVERVTIPTGGTAQLKVATIDDTTDEPDGSVSATLVAGDGYTVSATAGQAAVSVLDNDDPAPVVPEVTITGGADVTEGGDALFTLKAAPAPAAALTVEVHLKAPTGEFTALASDGAKVERVTIPTGGTAQLKVATIDDTTDEPDGSVSATLVAGDGYTVSATAGQAAVSVLDNDDPAPVVPEVTITGGADVTEGGDALFTLKAAPAPAAALTVEVHLKAPTGEFTALASDGAKVERVTIPTGGTAQLKVATIDDTTDEPDGSVSATLVAGEGYTVSATAGQAAVSVLDNDDPAPVVPEVTITGGADVTEGGDALFTLKAAPAPAAALTVEVHLKAPTGEFTALVSDGAKVERVTIPTGGTAQLKVATIDDTTDEPDGSVSATLVAGEGYTVSATAGQAAVSVLDNDDPAPVVPEVTITGGADVTEGGDALFTLKAAPAPAAALTVEVHLKAPTGEFTALASDGAKVERVTIPTGGTAQLKVATIDDTTDEPDGSVSATLVAGDGYTVSATAGQAAVSVLDNDDPAPVVPEVTITGGADVTEGGDALFTLKAAPAPAAALTVEVHLKAPTGEFTALASDGAKVERVTIPTGGTAQLKVATIDDTTDEPDGSVSATLVAGDGYTVSATAGQAAVPVLDNDDPAPVVPEVTITGGADVTEGGDALFTLKAAPAPAAALTVEVHLKAPTGEFTALASDGAKVERVTIPTGGTAQLKVATIDDTTDEPDGSVSATLVAGDDYTVSATAGQAAVSVLDNDDPAPEVSITAGPDITLGREAVFTLTAAPAPSAALEVKVAVTETDSSGDAVESTRRVTIPVGGTVELRLGTPYNKVGDPDNPGDADEPDRRYTAALVSGAGYAVSGDASRAEVSVFDPPMVVFHDAKGTEGSALVFTAKLTSPSPGGVSVFWETAGLWERDMVREAEAGVDYETASGTLDFALGEVEKTLTVETYDNTRNDVDKLFQVRMTGAKRIMQSRRFPHAVGTILDDDDPGVSVHIHDAEGAEGSVLEFSVTLSKPSPGGVWVTWVTADGAAKAGVDYEAASGRLEFALGEVKKTLSVRTLDDAHNDSGETFHVVLDGTKGVRNPRVGGRFKATGTILNHDPMPKAYMARFGRAVAEQALDAIANRLEAPRRDGFEARFAGYSLAVGAPVIDAANRPPSRGAMAHPPGMAPHRVGDSVTRLNSAPHGAMGVNLGHRLAGSAFTLTGSEAAEGGSVAFWGRGAQTRFDSRDGTLDLEGEIATALLGADYAKDNWLVGVTLAHSRGDGDYRDGAVADRMPANGGSAVRSGMDRSVETSLTAAIPYAAWRGSERLQVWGATGYGRGRATLVPGAGPAIRTDMDWTMAAAGLRSAQILPAAGGGPSLALVSDALWARTTAEAATGLAAADAGVTRLRLGLEGGWAFNLGDGTLKPKLELGARHDAGDAETGFGVELGGGLAWVDWNRGLRIEIDGRTLVAHADSGFEDHGFSASLAYDPTPDSARGLSLTLRQVAGAPAKGGLDALFSNNPLGHRHGGVFGQVYAARWSTEAAYGLPAFGGRFTGSPHVGYGTSAFGRDLSVGWRLTPAHGGPALSLGALLTRREAVAAALEYGVGVEARARW